MNIEYTFFPKKHDITMDKFSANKYENSFKGSW